MTLAADPALSARCRDPVLRHPGGAACARPARAASRRARVRCWSRSGRREELREAVAWTRLAETLAPVCDGDRRGAARVAGAGRADRLRRRALDGGELHGRGRRRQRFRRSPRRWAYREPESFGRLIDLLVDATSAYLLQQIEAGAEVLQLFDSWAGVLSPAALERWALAADGRDRAAREGADIPTFRSSCFRAASAPPTRAMRPSAAATALSLDTAVAPEWAAATAAAGHGACRAISIRWSWWPAASAMREEATRILERLGGGPFVFNLGHGIVPETPPEHVAALCELVHGWKRPLAVAARRRIAVVLFNLGGPDSAGGGRAVPVQSVQRSGDHRPAGPLRPLLAQADRAAARADGARHLRPDRRPLADPAEHRGAGRARWPSSCATSATVAGAIAHALLASDERRRWRRR